MAGIVINDSRFTKGNLSVSRQDNESEISIVGILTTHRYFEEINQIESYRYLLKGVKVYREDFGTDDHKIAYSFKATELVVKGIDEANESLFNNEEIEKLEEELFPGEDINKREKEGEKDGRE